MSEVASVSYPHAVYRLRTPELKKDGKFAEIGWNEAYEQLHCILKSAADTNGPSSTAVILSPFDATEEIFLQIKYARSIDPQVWPVFPPPPIVGEDQVFENGTIKAEKCPNRRGAAKVIAHFGGNVCTLAELASNEIVAVLISAPLAEPGANVVASTIIPLGTASTDCYEQATLSLPTVTWAEKSGVYENFEGRVQPFVQVIPPSGQSHSTGQIFWDLLGHPGLYDVATVRTALAATMREYAGIFEPIHAVKVAEMQLTEL